MTDLQKKQYWHTLNLRRLTLMAARAAMGAGSVEDGPAEPEIEWGQGYFLLGDRRCEYDESFEGYTHLISSYGIKRESKTSGGYVLQIYSLDGEESLISDNIPYKKTNTVEIEGSSVTLTYISES